MADEPERSRDDPARSWDDQATPPSSEFDRNIDEVATDDTPVEPETVGTGSYIAVSCVAAMGLLLVVLIVGLLISRLIG